ncbi:alpha/beta hydrolase-fold protein [Pseudoalteromonas xiamenensis]|uniref:alpha/beta hydrolase-fold protein n=1 Tax=Pseudoalteromonas xiamenensis TaxID=882626 RepID=UPI0027E3D668|nr:alpha/beta hydrolase-fold protein [Pseudoalteromonas xiamenensis]WMN60879.1 alpha/beta hydrolase-fold protein [Pseudoalteromonas xiamenensis]
MRFSKCLILVLSVALSSLFSSSSVFSQEESSKSASEYTMQTHVIKSKILNEERTVVVQLPKSYKANSNKVYPVIYRLDGANNLPLISSVIERLQNTNSAPEVIVVAIENTDRLRDLYPTVNEEPQGPVGLGGGGAVFLSFFEKELIPLIDKTYRTHDFKVISGASAAGVFVLYAMQARPHLFQAHLAYSPAVWWNYGAATTRTKQFIKETHTLDTYLYMNIGEESGVMRERYDELQQFILHNKPTNMTYVSDAFDGVQHDLTAVAGVFNAYHKLFMPKQMPLNALSKDVASIDAYYEKLSKQWGDNIEPPEGAVRQLGYQLVRSQNYDKAINVFIHNTKLHPNSVDAWFGLSYGYESKEDNANALNSLEHAIKLADKSYPYFDMLMSSQARLKAVVLN